MDATITLPGRFNGPPDSGNGGYSCGMLARFIDGPARVRLHVPPPLDALMAVRAIEQGGFGMFAGDTLVGSAFPDRFELDVPPAPSLDQAADARTRYRCYEHHVFPTCFVCGPGRPAQDGLDVFAGEVKGQSVLACPWTPAPDLLDEGGKIRTEIVWAALDCPGYFACMGDDIRPAVLGELRLDLSLPVQGGQALVVYSWPLGEDGRKLYAGAALADASGRVLARARSTWILLRT